MPNAAEAIGYVKSLNRRTRAHIPSNMKAAREAVPPSYIFNVYPQSWTKGLGSLGTFVIPACPEGAEYSEPLVVKSFIDCEYDLGDGTGRMGWFPENGEQVAKDIVGIGSSLETLQPCTTNKEWLGVFISKSNPPRKSEIQEAKNKLTRYMQVLLKEADDLALGGEKGISQIGSMHRKAVKFLNQSRAWAVMPEKLDSCPGCQQQIRKGVVRHDCGAILDWDKAIELGMVKASEKPGASIA